MSAARRDNKGNASPDKKRSSVASAFPYPSCWQDDERMNVLMAPFRLRSVNPEHYDGKKLFWQDLIATYCTHKGVVHFCKQDLIVVFQRNQRIPNCLDDILEQMQNEGKLRLRTDYEYNPENSWKGWAVNSFVRKPVKSIFSMVMGPESNQNDTLQYVHVDIINQFCKQLESEVLANNAGKLFHYKDFKDLIDESLNITDTALLLCLLKLQRQQKIGLEYKNGANEIHIIKIPLKNDTTEVNENDRAMHNLQMTKRSLTENLENLELEITQVDAKIHQSLRENKRKTAKTFLKKKKLLEKNYESRSNALFNIESLTHSLDEARNNSDILDAYKIGSKTLQNVLNQSGLKYDNVDEIISNVRDTIDQAGDIQDQLSNNDLTNDILQVGDDDELEQELREIMGEAEDAENSNNTPNAAKINTNANANNSQQIINSIKISDKELLDMLEGLEVNDTSLTASNISKPANI